MTRLLLILALLSGCVAVPPARVVGQEPDIYTPLYEVPVFLRYGTLFIAPLVADYIDAVHEYLEKHEPGLGRGKVVVYPYRGLHTTRNKMVGKVGGVREVHSAEVRVEWNPNEGLHHYASVRLRQAHWAKNSYTTDIADKASAFAKQRVAARY